MTKPRRVVIVILDSLGAGELPDASLFGDEGSNTLGNTARAVGGLELANLEAMGLGKIIPIEGLRDDITPRAFYGKMTEVSGAKDTTTGHWEITGIVTAKPFPTYPNGFPGEIIEKFTKAIGRPVLGNKPASGTEIIKELGEEHIRTGNPIVYTSADSVFQIAAHQEVLPLKELYQICQTAREMLVGEHAVARVIARPFTGKPGNFARTADRRDFSIQPLDQTILDQLVTMGIEVIGIGKIEDLFGGRGITKAFHTQSNRDGVNQTLEVMKHLKSGLIFTSLVEFDTLWGHRNDPVGFARGLEEFDAMFPVILDFLKEDDLLSMTTESLL